MLWKGHQCCQGRWKCLWHCIQLILYLGVQNQVQIWVPSGVVYSSIFEQAWQLHKVLDWAYQAQRCNIILRYQVWWKTYPNICSSTSVILVVDIFVHNGFFKQLQVGYLLNPPIFFRNNEDGWCPFRGPTWFENINSTMWSSSFLKVQDMHSDACHYFDMNFLCGLTSKELLNNFLCSDKMLNRSCHWSNDNAITWMPPHGCWLVHIWHPICELHMIWCVCPHGTWPHGPYQVEWKVRCNKNVTKIQMHCRDIYHTPSILLD